MLGASSGKRKEGVALKLEVIERKGPSFLLAGMDSSTMNAKTQQGEHFWFVCSLGAPSAAFAVS